MAVITGLEVPITPLPLRKRNAGLLLDVAEPLDVRFPERAEGGVRFCPIGCDTITAYDDTYCPTASVPSTDPDSDAEVTFNSFNIAADVTSPVRWDADVALDIADQRMSAMESAQVTSELLTGAITGNPSLAGNVTHLVAAAVTSANLPAVLADIMSGFQNLEFTVHTTPMVFEQLTEQFDVEGEAEVGARLSTGHPITADSGLTDTTIEVNDPAGGADVALPANAHWTFATLTPHVWLGEKRVWGEGTGGFDIIEGHNDRTQVLERPAIVAFDPCVVIAVATAVPAYAVATVP